MLRQSLSSWSLPRASPTPRTFHTWDLGPSAASCRIPFPCCSLDFSLSFIFPLLKLQPELLMLHKLPCSQTFSFNFPLSDLAARRFQCRVHQCRFPLLWESFLGCPTFPEQSRSHPPIPWEQQTPKGKRGEPQLPTGIVT